MAGTSKASIRNSLRARSNKQNARSTTPRSTSTAAPMPMAMPIRPPNVKTGGGFKLRLDPSPQPGGLITTLKPKAPPGKRQIRPVGTPRTGTHPAKVKPPLLSAPMNGTQGATPPPSMKGKIRQPGPVKMRDTTQRPAKLAAWASKISSKAGPSRGGTLMPSYVMSRAATTRKQAELSKRKPMVSRPQRSGLINKPRMRPVAPYARITTVDDLYKDSDEDDFISSDEDENEWKREIKKVTGYDPTAFDEDGGEARVSNTEMLRREEAISRRIAHRAEFEEIRKLEAAKISEEEEEEYGSSSAEELEDFIVS